MLLWMRSCGMGLHLCMAMRKMFLLAMFVLHGFLYTGSQPAHAVDARANL